MASPVGDRAQDRGRRRAGTQPAALQHPGASRPSGAVREPASEAVACLEVEDARLQAQKSQARHGESVGSSSRRASMFHRLRRPGRTHAPVRRGPPGRLRGQAAAGWSSRLACPTCAWRAGGPARQRRAATDAALIEPITRTPRLGCWVFFGHCLFCASGRLGQAQEFAFRLIRAATL